MNPPQLSRMSRKVVNRALQLMHRYPHRYDQTEPLRPRLKAGGCGAVGCIGGFIHAAAAQLKMGSPSLSETICSSNKTADLLGSRIGLDEVAQFYYLYRWPYDFFQAFNAAKTNRAKAAVAIRRMRHWLKTGE